MAGVATILTCNSGKRIKLVKELAKGGEGTVYTTDDPTLVAKIYHKPDAAIEQKLRCMLRHPLEPKADGVHLLIAWPQAVLYENDVFVGYAMPLVKDTHPIYIVARNNPQHSQDCHKVFPNYDWRYSLMVAYHLAWTVSYIHQHNYVIGDMNSNNIVIHGDGTVTILDVDSFDITDPDTGTRYPCNVGISEFLAPELQGRDLRRASFTKQTDEFALAVHIFILLMNNCHPFTLRALKPEEMSFSNVNMVCGPKQSVAQDQKMVNIVNGYCPFIKQIAGYGIPSFAPRMTMLPRAIQEAFRKTFGYDSQTMLSSINNRTNADQWRVLLYNLFQRAKGPNPDLIRCSANQEHFYLAGHGCCELCAAQKRHNTLLANSSAQFSSGGQSNVTSMQTWKVRKRCINRSETDRQTDETSFPAGSKVYIHFEVTDGIPGQKHQFSFVYTDQNGIARAKTALNAPAGVGDMMSIFTENVRPGTHKVEIYDGNQKLSEASYTVEASKKTGFFARLFS